MRGIIGEELALPRCRILFLESLRLVGIHELVGNALSNLRLSAVERGRLRRRRNNGPVEFLIEHFAPSDIVVRRAVSLRCHCRLQDEQSVAANAWTGDHTTNATLLSAAATAGAMMPPSE